jgi:uncharacterized protein YbbC (DUF1343 family)
MLKLTANMATLITGREKRCSDLPIKRLAMKNDKFIIMKYKSTQLFIFLALATSLSCTKAQIKLGAQQTTNYFPLLSVKNIAVVANQTSMINNVHLVDSLIGADVNVLKVFSPEHGFRGKADAGSHIENEIDKLSGLPIVSLYGKNKKPSSHQLQNIDVIVFDIQDVGARFYTYISTLHYVMEAAAQNNISVIVLDRPNPNIHYVDGPVLDTAFTSFVGMHPIPVVHGMTIGEYAQMINGQKWLEDELSCDLTVIKMQNYDRQTKYDLPVNPSPNLSNSIAINLYPSLCFFEGTNVSVGRGTNIPFQHFGAPYLQTDYSFTPKSGPGSKYPKYQNQKCFGKNLTMENTLDYINLDYLIYAFQNCLDKDDFFNNFFAKLAGGNNLRDQIISGNSANEIRQSWQKGLQEFNEMREPYLLY